VSQTGPQHPRSFRRHGLGRGLDALLLNADVETAADSVLVTLDPNSVAPNPEQPRRYFDEEALDSLAESIRLHGLLHPIIVERTGDGYRLVAGERRLRAAQRAGVASLPAIVRPGGESDRQSLELALTENLQRADLNPMEEAAAYARLSDAFGMTQEAIGLRVGKARGVISGAVRLLTLPAEVQTAVAEGRITAGHARALLALRDPSKQEEMAAYIEASGMSADEAHARVQRFAHPEREAPSRAGRGASSPPLIPDISPDDEAVRRGLETALGAPVVLRRRRRGGEVAIGFASNDDLAALYRRLGGPQL